MANDLASALSYIPTVPASSLVTIGAIAIVVRKREGLNNINRPILKCFSLRAVILAVLQIPALYGYS